MTRCIVKECQLFSLYQLLVPFLSGEGHNNHNDNLLCCECEELAFLFNFFSMIIINVWIVLLSISITIKFAFTHQYIVLLPGASSISADQSSESLLENRIDRVSYRWEWSSLRHWWIKTQVNFLEIGSFLIIGPNNVDVARNSLTEDQHNISDRKLAENSSSKVPNWGTPKWRWSQQGEVL